MGTHGGSFHWNVTEHPTADWTIQQFGVVITRIERLRTAGAD
jgi:hypothetical protein